MLSYFFLRSVATSLNSLSRLKHVFFWHEPDTPWHLQIIANLSLTAWNRREVSRNSDDVIAKSLKLLNRPGQSNINFCISTGTWKFRALSSQVGNTMTINLQIISFRSTRLQGLTEFWPTLGKSYVSKGFTWLNKLRCRQNHEHILTKISTPLSDRIKPWCCFLSQCGDLCFKSWNCAAELHFTTGYLGNVIHQLLLNNMPCWADTVANSRKNAWNHQLDFIENKVNFLKFPMKDSLRVERAPFADCFDVSARSLNIPKNIDPNKFTKITRIYPRQKSSKSALKNYFHSFPLALEH